MLACCLGFSNLFPVSAQKANSETGKRGLWIKYNVDVMPLNTLEFNDPYRQRLRKSGWQECGAGLESLFQSVFICGVLSPGSEYFQSSFAVHVIAVIEVGSVLQPCSRDPDCSAGPEIRQLV